ncbi:hypothetical protein DV515_00006414, partial [Chloebia gouldiae]
MDKASDFGSEDCRLGRSRERGKEKRQEKHPNIPLFPCSGSEPRSSQRRTSEGGKLAAPRASE